MDSKALLHGIRSRPVNFVPGKKVVSTAPGEWTSPYEGKGYEPLGYRDFEIGDDPRRINIPATARRGELTIVERVALRDFKIMVIIDSSPSMMVREKLDIQIGVAASLLYSAWKSETTFGLGINTEQGIRSLGMGIGSRHFYHLYQKLWDTFEPDKNSLKGARKLHLSRCLPPNAMMIYCSDFMQGDGSLIDLLALKRSIQRYDFIPIIIQDEFESSFPILEHGTFISFSNPETGAREDVWMSKPEAIKIQSIHEARFNNLTDVLGMPGANSIHLTSPDIKLSIKTIDNFFRRRSGRSG
ncbi:MAG: DUF58 domain-containing protein [Gammaproteobacteria bacterium]|nr:DUF58 domain-containing protein [Gammaproteobacteria bacterium]